MKNTKKCSRTHQIRQSISSKLDKLCYKRRSSADSIRTSSAVSAVTSLILIRDGSCRSLSPKIFAKRKTFWRSPYERHPSYLLTSTLLLLFAFTFISNVNPASATTSSLTISVADSISLNTVGLSSSGNFATSDTSTSNISVLTNNGTGYTLGIVASTANSNALVNAEDNTKTIPTHSVSAGVSADNYADDDYASENSLNDTWGYRPSKYYDTTNSVVVDNTSTNLYFPGPTSATDITTLDNTTEANDSTANTYNIAIGARITDSTPAGSYSNSFVFTVVANPAVYSISYNDNSSAGGSGFPANVTDATTSSETVTLSSTTPTRTGYDFAGWCTVNTADDASCTGTSYGAGDTFTLDQTASSASSANTLELYAMWTIKVLTITVSNSNTTSSSDSLAITYGDSATITVTPSSGYYLSAVTCPSGYTCTGYSTPSIDTQTLIITNESDSGGTLKFTGSTGTFAVAYAAAGAEKTNGYYAMQDITAKICKAVANWQTASLIDTRDNQVYSVAKLNGNCWMTKNLAIGCAGYSASRNDITLTSSDSNVSSDYTLSASAVPDFNSSNNSSNWTIAAMQCDATYGGYYNYKAATAGTISGTNSAADTKNICPKGWTLPTYTQAKTIGDATTAYLGSFSKYQYGGRYVDGSRSSAGSVGYWYTATAYIKNQYKCRYFMSNNSEKLTTTYCNSVYIFPSHGISLRCFRSS